MSSRSPQAASNGRNVDLYLPHLKPKGGDKPRDRSLMILSARAASLGSDEGSLQGSPVKQRNSKSIFSPVL